MLLKRTKTRLVLFKKKSQICHQYYTVSTSEGDISHSTKNNKNLTTNTLHINNTIKKSDRGIYLANWHKFGKP